MAEDIVSSTLAESDWGREGYLPAPFLGWGGGRAFARPARLSNSTQCLETLTASLSPASTSSDRARVSAAIMSRQVSTSAT